ncbi:hypothetical protein [Dysgonomonas termitidis]|uniref:hypothetical protein n=1 Tax=Dysgonomonas termitidis TaxID=1516126 RepID=UPI0036D23822
MNRQRYPHHRSIRLYGYDYSQEGLYFITICEDKACLSGDIVDAGRIVREEWKDTEVLKHNR